MSSDPPPDANTTIPTEDGGAAVARSYTAGTDDFQFIRVLGRGVFGEVWLAKKVPSGIEKAVKILMQAADHDAAQRERRALELIKNLRHPYLLATEDFWVAGNRLHVVMELADGTLRHRMHACREAGLPGIPEGELLGYLWESAEGLDFLHSRHVVHRDVKPDNILLLNGHAKVGDFGLAREQDGVIEAMQTLAGTPAYMAPEMWGREGGPPSDLYSLAVAYVELRQGTPPLRARPIPEMLVAHQEGVFELLEVIGVEERTVIMKALAKRPEDRYPTCLAFVEALAAALGRSGAPRSGVRGTPAFLDRPPFHPEAGNSTRTPHAIGTVADSPGSATDAASLRNRRREWLAGLAFAFLVGAVGLGVWKFGGSDASKRGTEVKPQAKVTPTADAKEITLADGRRAFDIATIQVRDSVVRFRLIAVSGGPRPVAPFYIMESKVWNDLYQVRGTQLPPGSQWNGPNAPVMGVTAEEAAQFARDVFDGDLPSPDAWDAAAGRYTVTTRDFVTRPGGHPRVLLAKPGATHGPDGGEDINEFGLRDMAGNGREWTRATLSQSGSATKRVGADPLSATDLVILRGRNFTLARGLTFSTLEYEQTTPQTQFPQVRSPYTGFRVVIPVP